MPLSSCKPRSSKVSPEPATRYLTVEETSTYLRRRFDSYLARVSNWTSIVLVLTGDAGCDAGTRAPGTDRGEHGRDLDEQGRHAGHRGYRERRGSAGTGG